MDLSRFGLPETPVLPNQQPEDVPQAKRRALSELETGPGPEMLYDSLSKLSQTVSGAMDARVFPATTDSQLSGTTPITSTLISVLQTSELDQKYYKFLERSFVFTVFAQGNNVSQPLHLNRCNAKMREDFQAKVRQELYQAQNRIVQAGPGLVGLGMKRDRSKQFDIGTASEEYGFHSMENVKQYLRFLGLVPTASKKESNANTGIYFPMRETPLTVQYSGVANGIPNVWGNVSVGDYLSFHVTRINKISESSGFSSLEDFGPIQIVPVASPNKSVAYGSSKNLHNFWAHMKSKATDINNGVVPPEFGSDQYGPFVMRSGSTDTSLFSMINPIREFIHGKKPCDAAHWAPRVINAKTRDMTAAPDSEPQTNQLLVAELVPNIVYPVGRVVKLPPSAKGGMTDQMRETLLLDGSGQKLSQHSYGNIDIQLEVFAH